MVTEPTGADKPFVFITITYTIMQIIICHKTGVIGS